MTSSQPYKRLPYRRMVIVLLVVMVNVALSQYVNNHDQHQHNNHDYMARTHTSQYHQSQNDYDRHVQQFSRGAHGGGVNASDASGCHGILHSPCLCNMTAVTCINAQFTDANVFHRINSSNFPALTHLTFKGNNFQNLNGSIFGAGRSLEHSYLIVLNLSSNYIVHVHENALNNVPALRYLDLTDNELVLDGTDERRFLSYVPELRELYLRRALNPNVNQTANTQHLTSIFESARLPNLVNLDLSFNGLKSVPYQLGCYFPQLRTLDLSINQLETLHLNGSCFRHLDTLSIRFNRLVTLGLQLRRTADALPAYSLMAGYNKYQCDCNSVAYIKWLRASTSIQDVSNMQCWRASPVEYENAQLAEVPIEKLDCSRNLTSSAVSTRRIHFFGANSNVQSLFYFGISVMTASCVIVTVGLIDRL